MVFVALLTALSAASFAGVFVSITVAPPPLPVYAQPVCPGPGYIWTPGYWAWGDEGYYWVPGTWIMAPAPGMLWTPGYWGWSGGAYIWHAGYWGPHVGFYGGVNYGFGYFGSGFVGGEWRHGSFFYNSAVMNVHGPHITNVYVNKTVIVNERNVTRVSYNGPGGIRRAPSGPERLAERDRHMDATDHQMRHMDSAARNPQMYVRNNSGRPAVAATPRPGEFGGRDAVPARSAGGRVSPSTMNANPRAMPQGRDTSRGNQPSNMNRGPEQPRSQMQPMRPGQNGTMQRGNSQPSNASRPQQQQMQRQAPQQQQMQQRQAPQQRAPQAQPRHQGGEQGRGEPQHEQREDRRR